MNGTKNNTFAFFSEGLQDALAVLLRPRLFFARLGEDSKPRWLFAMLIASLSLIFFLAAQGYWQAQRTATNGINLPPEAQWWTAEMQNNYILAMQQAQGVVFVYIIPMVLGLLKLWMGWFALGGIFHLVFTLLGGRGSLTSALNVTAWASLVFALRDLLRVVFILGAQRPILSPGFSGFVQSSGMGWLFFAQALQQVDIFLVWFGFLAALGLMKTDNLNRGTSIVGVVLVILLSILAQAGMGAAIANLSSLFL